MPKASRPTTHRITASVTPPPVRIPRRRFLQQGALVVGTIAGASRAAVHAQPDAVLAPHLADVDGDGVVDARDEQLVRNALFSRRGAGLRPAPTFDYRADVLGRGRVDMSTLDAVRASVAALSGPAARARRPITVAWHYGWYNQPIRRPGVQTVGFKGGAYASSDPAVETLFNDQKNEFGITVDAVSWIPPLFNGGMLANYRQGLLRTGNLHTRHLALLYESTICLPLDAQDRVDFFDPAVSARLSDHFARMAQFLVEARAGSGARIFRLDGRPVMFIFGSHTWGANPADAAQFDALDTAFDRARDAFRAVYGVPPYVVGEEMYLSTSGAFSFDRRRRTEGFDAIHVYHHASNLKPEEVAGVPGVVLQLSPHYVDTQLAILADTYTSLEGVTNRHTGHPILVIPNLAPGFAKPGLPTLLMTRQPYTDFMRTLERFHLDQHVNSVFAAALGTGRLPAPVYIVGSWNEEFEGHAVFPAAFNDSVGAFEQDGFDLLMAIREVFGWNHYAQRAISS